MTLISERYPGHSLLDSSKYVARYLLLRNVTAARLKGIYLVRDVRGLVYSFKKKVQTSTPPIRTVIYYLVINFFAEVTYRVKPKGEILKIKYEDLIKNPSRELKTIGKHIEHDLSQINQMINDNKEFNMPDIVGGNRIKSKKTIKFKGDLDWKDNMSRHEKTLYYILTIPFMLLNKYKLSGK